MYGGTFANDIQTIRHLDVDPRAVNRQWCTSITIAYTDWSGRKSHNQLTD